MCELGQVGLWDYAMPCTVSYVQMEMEMIIQAIDSVDFYSLFFSPRSALWRVANPDLKGKRLTEVRGWYAEELSLNSLSHGSS